MFSHIEERRKAAGIPQNVLCERAGVHTTTYTARKSGRRGVSERTIRKLDEALSELIGERRRALEDVEGRS